MARLDREGPIAGRRARLARELEAHRLDWLLIARPANVFYLTGFQGSAGAALLGAERGKLWVDPRYILQAREQAQGVEVKETRADLMKAAGEWLGKKGGARVGYDDATMTCAEFRRIVETARRGPPAAAKGKIDWIAAGGLVEELRAVKDAGEIELMRRAAQVTVEAFEEVLAMVKPGIREIELAAEIEYRMKRKGAEGPAFETIVASGPRSAWPHARPSSKLLQQGELVILDLGAILGGYAADMTRSVYLGKPPRGIRRLYEAVRQAQANAAAALRAGRPAAWPDRVAKRTLAKKGLDRYFTHSTGHGVGIEVHERPRLARNEKTRLASGNVVTVEPGIYIEGLGGIRIEDTLRVTDGAPEILTPASKDGWWIA